MITQAYLDDEIALAKKIFIYYTDKVVDYLSVASDRYIKWYVDSLQLYILLGTLKDIRIESGTMYIGSAEVTTSFVLNVFDKIREYYLFDVDTDYEFGEAAIATTPSYIQPYTAQWKEFTIISTEDRPTTLTMPVNVNIMSVSSIDLSVNGLDDPNYTTDIEANGYHMANNTLYWHNDYAIMTGDVIRVQYLQIVG